MKNTIIHLIFGFTLFFAGFSSGQDLQVQLRMAKKEFVLGEPIYIYQVWHNSSDKDLSLPYFPDPDSIKAAGPIKKECGGPKVDVKKTANHILKAKQELRVVAQAEYYGITDSGDYEIWAEYDCTRFEYSSRLRAESNHLRFRIVLPIGMDAAAFQEFNTVCNKLKPGVLEKYPTSTYAAYALFGDHEVSKWALKFDPKVDVAAYPNSVQAMNGDPQKVEQLFAQKFELLQRWERLHSEFPQFPYMDDVLIVLAQTYLHTGNYQKAVDVLKELLKRFPKSEASEIATRYREALVACNKWEQKKP